MSTPEWEQDARRLEQDANEWASGTDCDECGGTGVAVNGNADPTTCPSCNGVGLVWDLDPNGDSLASGDELMERVAS